MRYTISSLIALAASAAALTVTYPTEGAEIDLSKSLTIKWSSVSSDASTFNIELVNMIVYPNVQQTLASNVETSAGSYTVNSVSGVSSGHGFQINLISDSTENTGILAQSQQFNVTGDSSSTSSASSTSTGKSTATDVSSTSTSTSAVTSALVGSSTTLATSSATGTTTATKTGSASSTASGTAATKSSSAAASLVVPATAGSFLLGLFALVM